MDKDKQKIQTKFGTAVPDDRGYYWISSRAEGNHRRLLHRLVFEDFYQIKLPKHIHIHHLDEDKSNNEIWNLIPMTPAEHNKLHHCGRISSIKDMIVKSISKNSSGYFRVSKIRRKAMKQGFFWAYQYYDKNNVRRNIRSVDIKKLEKKVKENGLPWFKITDKLCWIDEIKEGIT